MKELIKKAVEMYNTAKEDKEFFDTDALFFIVEEIAEENNLTDDEMKTLSVEASKLID